MRKILIITGSPRKGGNSDMLAQAFAEGAEGGGNLVKFFHAGRKHIEGCRVCDTCFTTGKACTFDDDFNELAELLEWADGLVLATPLYWYTFSAQIKAALDKMYAFMHAEKELKIRDLFLIACAADGPEAFEGLVKSYEAIVTYLKCDDAGKLLIPDVWDKGEVTKEHLDAAKTAGFVFDMSNYMTL